MKTLLLAGATLALLTACVPVAVKNLPIIDPGPLSSAAERLQDRNLNTLTVSPQE